MSLDFLFSNTNLAVVSGAVAAFAVFQTVHAAWRQYKLLRSTQVSVAELKDDIQGLWSSTDKAFESSERLLESMALQLETTVEENARLRAEIERLTAQASSQAKGTARGE
jgi:regulator of replication initiation timing